MKTLLFFLLLISFSCFSQELEEYNRERAALDKNLMIGLGSWATGNLILGGIGWATADDQEWESFHQMNVMWNAVNLGLAIPGYLKAKKSENGISFAESIHAQHKTEKIFLINSGLDVGYISAGLLLRSEAKTNVEKRDQFNGFGNGLLLQGGFLLVFDLTAYFVHQRHARKGLSKLMNSVQLSSQGIGLQWNLSVHKSATTSRQVNPFL